MASCHDERATLTTQHANDVSEQAREVVNQMQDFVAGHNIHTVCRYFCPSLRRQDRYDRRKRS